MNLTGDQLVLLVQALFGLISIILTVFVVPYIKAKTTKEQRANIYNKVKIAVSAADQLLKIEDGTGAKRKKFVLDKLNAQGLKIEEDDLDLMIESAVEELNRLQQHILL